MNESTHVQDELVAFIDGELLDADRARVEEHLVACPACREERALLDVAIQASRRGPTVEPSPQLRRDVLNAIAAERLPWRERWRRLLTPRLLVPVSALGVAALAFLVGFQHRERPGAMVEYAVADRLELLKDYDLVSSAAAEGIAPEDLDVVAHLHELGE